MSEYTLVNRDEAIDGTGVQEVKAEFEADDLDTLAEKLFWFVQASGFSYLDGITLHKAHGDISFKL